MSVISAPASTPAAQKRIVWIDVAKGIGILLVLYGHLIEQVATFGNPVALLQFQVIYSFHMPLFFFLAGYVGRYQVTNFGSYIARCARSRLWPAVALSLALVPFWFVLPKLGLQTIPRALDPAAMAWGVAQLNITTWFLVCLFWTDLLMPLFKPARPYYSLSLTIGFYALGIWLINNTRLPAWHLPEALVASSFCALGAMARYYRWLEHRAIWRLVVVAAPLAVWAALANDAPYRGNVAGVVMSASHHGNLILFSLAAVAGTLTVVLVSKVLERSRVLAWVGRHALILLAVTGVTYHFVNRPLVTWLLHGL